MAANLIEVFYSSTEEEYIKKYAAAFDSEMTMIGSLLDVRFDIIHWKTRVPGGLASTAQEKVDVYVKGRYQIYVGVMGTQFGAGTEHEYEQAIEDHIKDGTPIVVLFGFCQEKINPYEVHGTFSQIKQFRDDIKNSKKYGRANLYFEFDGTNAFRRRIQQHIKPAVDLIRSGVLGGPRFA